MHTLEPFMFWESLDHIAISALPFTFLHLSKAKHIMANYILPLDTISKH